MVPELNDVPEVIETPESEEESVETPEASEETAEEKIARLQEERDALEAKSRDFEEKNKKLYARLKNGEKPRTEASMAESSNNTADMIALMNAKVHEDDIERVEWFAKANNLTVRAALKHPEMKAILSLREEHRTSANSSNTATVRRGPVQTSEQTLLENARQGVLPESDDEIDRLIAAKSKRVR